MSKEWKESSLLSTPLLGIDLELTSLQTDVAKITSIAWLEAKAQSINMDSAQYSLVRTSGDLAQSPVIHGLTAKDLAQGEHVSVLVKQLESYSKTHIWVLHNAALDMQVLHKVATSLKLPESYILTLDTMLLELYLLNKAQAPVKQNALTLEECRQRYQLPSAPNHNALDDALASLTLAFAQLHAIDAKGVATIGDLLQSKAFRVFRVGIEGKRNVGKR
ncbi:3'-5' exonuclease [Glaciecola sp. MH2013]|nr:3'-5' exonuclease [Glaciecola sp. MH2013]